MSSSSNNIPGDAKLKSKFVSETELDERRKKRQEEWEKVRKPEDPLEAPEEEYDPRSLFARLEEQKQKKQADYEEAHRLKNLIRGLDDDEVSFLELVDKTKMEIECQRWKEDKEEIQEYRKAVASLSGETSEAKLQELKKSITNNQGTSGAKKAHASLLSGAVKRKRDSNSEMPSNAKRTLSDSDSDGAAVPADSTEDGGNCISTDGAISEHDENGKETEKSPPKVPRLAARAGLQCLGVLPGLGVYSDSSDSENSSNSDAERETTEYDLLGRRRIQIVASQPAQSHHNHS